MNDDNTERGVSPVAPRRRWLSPKTRRLALTGGAGAAIALAVIGANTAIHDRGPEQKAPDTGSNVIAQVTQNPSQLVTSQATEQPRQPPATIMTQPPAVIMQAPRYVMMPAGSGGSSFDVAEPKKPDDTEDKQATAAAAKAAATTQVAFKSATLAGAKAGPAIRLTYVMMPQLVPCALETAMDSTVAGFFLCHTTQDVLSPDKIVLMPAGTRFTGTYKNDIRQGQNRLFSFVGSGITPDGIPVPLDSQVADGMGRSGIPGEVDNHFWPRFGAGILLAASQSVLSLAQASISKGGNTYLNFSAGGGGADVAMEILRQQEDQKPTISVQPGTLVSIVIANPIDFSDALRVRTRE